MCSLHPWQVAVCHSQQSRVTRCALAALCLQVGYFWLTNGLAFTPQHGSALYIDVRLVPHCSDPCTVLAGTASPLEGRYGELQLQRVMLL